MYEPSGLTLYDLTDGELAEREDRAVAARHAAWVRATEAYNAAHNMGEAYEDTGHSEPEAWARVTAAFQVAWDESERWDRVLFAIRWAQAQRENVARLGVA